MDETTTSSSSTSLGERLYWVALGGTLALCAVVMYLRYAAKPCDCQDSEATPPVRDFSRPSDGRFPPLTGGPRPVATEEMFGPPAPPPAPATFNGNGHDAGPRDFSRPDDGPFRPLQS